MRRISSPEKINGIKQFLRQSFNFASSTVEQVREGEGAALSRLPKLEGTRIEPVTVGRMRAEWIANGQAAVERKDAAVLYFHGGAFISGSCRTHRDLAARISLASGVRVLLIEYRLAPEHPYPAANEDCLSAYRWLLEQGIPAGGIILGGDSVGGTLALMTLLTVRDMGLATPAGAFLMSPHTDLVYFDSDSYVSRAELDPTGSRRGSQLCGDYYTGGQPPEERPSILSPLHAQLDGLPPLLIQVGDHEVLLDECARLAERAQAAGVEVTLQVWDEMWCVFQQLAGMLPEGEAAIGRIGEFINRMVRDKQVYSN